MATARGASTRRRLLTIGLASALVIAVSFAVGYAYQHRPLKVAYAKKEIPIWATSGNRKESGIWWIDNDVVMFYGSDPKILATNAGLDRPTDAPAIYTWNTRSNEYRREAELDVTGQLTCYENGKYRYYVAGLFDKTTKKREIQWYEAKLGGARVMIDAIPPSNGGINTGIWVIGRFGCVEGWERSFFEPDPLPRYRTIWPLRPRDGFLYVETETGDPGWPSAMFTPIKLKRPGQQTLSLPIEAKELLRSTIRFSEHANSYIVPAGVRKDETNPDRGGFGLGQPRPVYFISPDGKVDTRVFPATDWVAYGHGFLPTVSGYLVASNFTRRRESIDLGVWLIRDGRWVKIIDHVVEEFSVSPNGCKAVISTFNPDYGALLGRHLVVFDLCVGELRRDHR